MPDVRHYTARWSDFGNIQGQSWRVMIFLSKFTVDAGWMDIGRCTCGHVYRGQCFGWAATLADYSFLALFPARH
jgi:hypothetical protein